MLEGVLLPSLVRRLADRPDATALIRTISEQMADSTGLAAPTLEQAFTERLRRGGVATPEGVAFPHAVIAGVRRTVVGLIVIPGGLDLDAAQPPSTLVFAIAGDASRPWEHVRLLARLSASRSMTPHASAFARAPTTQPCSAPCLRRTRDMADDTHIARAATDARLLILIARTEESFDPLVTALLDAGITGATVLESRGIGAIIR